MPLFSVIIPVFNSEQYLVESVQSVLKQDFKSLEIILVDDCSTDKSSEICNFLCEQNKFIKIVRHEKNCGVSASRNSGINAACGEYIVFLDSDDCLSDGCLNNIAKLIEEKPKQHVIIGKYISDRYSQRGEDGSYQGFATFDNTTINSDDPDGIIAYINDFYLFSGVCWRYVINRNFIIENELYFINVKIDEDGEFVARLLCLARKFSFYDGYLYWYSQRAQGLSHLITHSEDYDLTVIYLKIANELSKFTKNNELSDLKKEFLYSRIKNCFEIFCRYLIMRNRKEIYKLSKMIELNIDNFKILENTSHDIDMYSFIKTFGAYYGLLLQKAFIIEKTISLIKGSENSEYYIFCADILGKTTAQILQNAGYQVRGFLDNNKGLEGSIISGLKVYTPSVLSHMSKDKLSNIFVIVCHKKRSVFDEISSKLEEIGLKRNRICNIKQI